MDLCVDLSPDIPSPSVKVNSGGQFPHPVGNLLIIAIDRSSQCISLARSRRASPENVAAPYGIATPEHIEAHGATAAPYRIATPEYVASPKDVRGI